MCRPIGLFCCALLVGVAFGGRPASAGDAGPGARTALDSDPHLVAWWKLDTTAGGKIVDSSKGGHDGVIQGGLGSPDRTVPGRFGSALEWRAGKDLVEVTGYKGIAGASPRTVSAWIKTRTARGEIIAWGADDFGKMWTFGFIRGHIGVTPSGGYLYMKDRINDGKWHHVAAVLTESEPAGLKDVSLYLDGLPATIDDIGQLDLWPIATGKELDVTIGRKFKGALDDVRIYARVLGDEEIKGLFELARKRKERPR